MFFGLITLFTSLLIAGIAAWFSIAGIMSVFAASAFSVAIMAGALELGKLVTASWLYRHWRTAPVMLKSYLTVAVMILMLITSMGIFGYLSKAHLDQNLSGTAAQAEIDRIQQMIEVRNSRITSAQTQLTALDTAVQNWIDGGYMTRAMAAQDSQKQQRADLESIIIANQDEISQLRDELMPHQAVVRNQDAKLGPIKYIGELIYGDDHEQTIDNTMRYFILLLVVVFDPLAVLLLIAANRSLLKHGVNLEGSEASEQLPEVDHTELDEPISELAETSLQDENAELAEMLSQLPEEEMEKLWDALNQDHSEKKRL